jgi:hypothetical protein
MLGTDGKVRSEPLPTKCPGEAAEPERLRPERPMLSIADAMDDGGMAA